VRARVSYHALRRGQLFKLKRANPANPGGD
jgi:hypothetical protein